MGGSREVDSSSEHGSDVRCIAIKSIAGFLCEIAAISDELERSSKVEYYVKCLEEERRKIDAFKRELPLCMYLLNDAIDVLRAEVTAGSSRNCRPVFEEFIPIKGGFDEGDDEKVQKDYDKMNWMSSVQLWNGDSHGVDDCCTSSTKTKVVDDLEKVEESDLAAPMNSFHQRKNTSGVSADAFVPFLRFSRLTDRRKKEDTILAVPDLSLFSPRVKSGCSESGGSGMSSRSDTGANHSASSNHQTHLTSQQQLRKSRRCWSPELHRRFVSALQQLGGAQAATPKQIRELMQVDGLTNDEVKSHLQKYRLHTRRMPTSASACSNQPVVLLGGVGVPHDNFQASKTIISPSGSPQGPLQLAAVLPTVSNTGGDSYEDEEERSESYSWRANFT